ncbi:hypothetical protein QBC34DRAFT_381838 [Podospora aff. communis PSN243]|uniref:Extracellular serine-rich protein n=1 Tax=Podospora aff. communis PSN243 TaxID=3040156 RepID=A0AAV9GJZ6_9PEZI|nr:hypothetical protein QBC34DRAFT_381838 [Podospora aff. communis PSN243]
MLAVMLRRAIGTLLTLRVIGAYAAHSVSNTILVFARDAASASSATSGFEGYGIPYQVVLVPQSGVSLPPLSASSTEGNYGGIVIVSEVAYLFSSGWGSALTAAQWQALYDYQTSFGVRMVRLDAFPSTDLGVTAAADGGGCCNAGVEQLVSISDSSAFPTANIKTGAGVSTQGLWHYPATVTNSTIAQQIATFSPDTGGLVTSTTTAAIINNFGGRKQMAWFMGWATDWSQSCNFLQHAYIHWMTRGLFVGKRKVYLSTQVDDMHLETGMYFPAGTSFRVRTSDLDVHKAWQADINGRLPSGSNYFIEIGHNGNGDIEEATETSSSAGVCNPNYGVEYDSPPDTPLEFQKPLGTGTDLWPAEFTNYTWSLTCAKLDSIATWFSNNVDTFASVSHTFTHEELNNATYYDASREIHFNIDWLKQIGLWDSPRFSPAGLIPPAITGLHNGDAIRAWMDNGIRIVVGDNTRPVLRNPTSSFWPLITTVEANGYAGLVIVPRWATTIYYNCAFQNCTLLEWINTSAGSGDFNTLLDNARSVNTRYLLGLHPDPFMFHQANLRYGDVESITVGSQSGPLSLFQIWVETITQEMTRLTNWPISSLKHDDIGALFLNRMELDGCSPNLRYNYSEDNSSIVSVTVTANGNSCGVQVPVTVPSGASGSARVEQVGSEPAIHWVSLTGSAVTLALSEPVAV